MRIIGFSTAATPSFLTVSVQAVAPWMSRIRHLLVQWMQQAAQGPADAQVQVRRSQAAAVGSDAGLARPKASVRLSQTAGRASSGSLRVVRESDSAIGAECAGRMVISGRMADVCAELDRMARRAAAAQKASVTTRP